MSLFHALLGVIAILRLNVTGWAAASTGLCGEKSCFVWRRHPKRWTRLGARTLLGAPGLTTRNKKLLGAPGIATSSKKILGARGRHPKKYQRALASRAIPPCHPAVPPPSGRAPNGSPTWQLPGTVRPRPRSHSPRRARPHRWIHPDSPRFSRNRLPT